MYFRSAKRYLGVCCRVDRIRNLAPKPDHTRRQQLRAPNNSISKSLSIHKFTSLRFGYGFYRNYLTSLLLQINNGLHPVR
jgi:hypothetical protein